MTRVLIIDNDPTLIEKLAFEHQDTVEYSAILHPEALTKMEINVDYDFVMLDLFLTEQAEPLIPDGLPLTQTIKNLLGDIPIILITGQSIKRSQKVGLLKEYSFKDIIEKPFDSEVSSKRSLVNLFKENILKEPQKVPPTSIDEIRSSIQNGNLKCAFEKIKALLRNESDINIHDTFTLIANDFSTLGEYERSGRMTSEELKTEKSRILHRLLGFIQSDLQKQLESIAFKLDRLSLLSLDFSKIKINK